ncbi:MAG: DNA-3-methyladenine glycosylase, partial [bacterium]|nr:DNA-3-methyladenine glycosylase [bacterium]
MRKILNQKFFNRPTLIVAKELLGKYLVRSQYFLIRANKKVLRIYKTEALMITEVEAYDGFKDKASHARHGKTERNKVMFGEAGRWYVYFTYGMHHMLNIATGAKEYPAAVLIRGVKNLPQLGRFTSKLGEMELNGPAKLTKFLKIDKKLNNELANRKTGLWIEDRGVKQKNNELRIMNKGGREEKYKIVKTPRIGI